MAKDAKQFLIPAVFGGALAVLTLNIQHLAVISKNPLWGGVQHCLITLILPGMVGAVVIGGNVHAPRLWLGTVLNGVIYFGLAWGVTALIRERKSRLRRPS